VIKKVPSGVDFVKQEHEILEFWEKNRIFEKLRKKNENGPRWKFIDGPITANNPMGVHHAWGRTYKDIFHRYKAMNGYNMRYQNGFDCQGLWVEVEVEKELGFKSKRDIEAYGIERFVNKCKERVYKYSKIQTQQSIRLGYWMDWDNSYYTMSGENNYTIWLFLKKCHEKGWIYKGHDVMPWCTRCGAALSEHEIATEGYRELTHTSVVVKFPLVGRENESLLVWTTTPWTLTSNTAAAVHPDKEYLRVRQGEQIYYLIKGRECELVGDYSVEGSLLGKEMLGWEYRGPFDDLPAQKNVKHVVIPWDEVSEEEGTGIVHIAPGCGQEDFALGKEFNLSVLAPLDEFGNYVDGFGWLTGKNVSEVTRPILNDLENKGIKYKEEEYTHRYPVCWRHGTELVFRLVDEWFISMDEVRYDIMEVTKKIKWIPEYGLDHELDWLRNMHDWMISKKRYWGLALPIWECHNCGHFTVIGGKEELREKAVEGWEKFEGHSPHRPWIDEVKIKCEKCGSIISRIPDVGNPWLDAGIVPYSTLKYTTDRKYWEKWFPADFICESLPGQFRNWFYSLLAMSTVLENREPFKVVLGYALVKDEKGKDMHKSAGNAIWFDEAAENMGVDVMRWLYASHNPFTNLLFGYNVANEIRRRLITIWNSYSFFTTYAEIDNFNLEDFKVDENDLSDLDRWLLARLNMLFRIARESYEEYLVHKFMGQVERFLDDLSNWYIRRSRRRFWKSEDDKDKKCAYFTLYKALKGLILVLAPIIPFTTEAIYQNLVRGVEEDAPESVHLCEFPKCDEKYIDESLVKRIDTIISLVSIGRAVRNKAGIKVRQPLSKVYIKPAPGVSADEIRPLSGQILDELNIKELEFISDEKDFVEYKVKLNYAKLGPKFGKDTGEIAKAIEKMDKIEISRKIEAGGTIEIPLDDKKVYLSSDDLIVEKEEKEGFASISENGHFVAIDIKITDELRKEGIVRDLIRHIQIMRKEADFEVDDRIEISLEMPEEVSAALEKFERYFMNETLCEKLNKDSVDGEYSKSFRIGSYEVKASVGRINSNKR